MNRKAKSILFLPFLQIPSGHHQAANALMDGIMEKDSSIKCHKIDILSFSYGNMEKMISSIYLKWIHAFPKVYNSIYKLAVYKKIEEAKRYRLYEFLFMSFMKKLIVEKRPDLIICTHALPAYMLNYLKKNSKIQTPVINVYTDYFIHRFWGLEEIDYHFVPSYEMKKYLLQRGIKESNIYTTGIPIHSKIKKMKQTPVHQKKPMLKVLISGGNLGLGGLEDLIKQIRNRKASRHVQYHVLCGKNRKLFEELSSLQTNDVIPYPYINSREVMDKLYDEIDAILTKPGGVTISECLFKRKPILIYDALPGQEKINLVQLKEAGLVFHLSKRNICEQIMEILQDESKFNQYQNQVDIFHSKIYFKEPEEIIMDILM